MKKIDLSSLATGKLEKLLFVSIRNIGKNIKMPHQLHLVRITFILRELYRGLLFGNDAILRIEEGPILFEANGVIYQFCSIDFDPTMKNTDEAKSIGGWIFLRLKIEGFINDNNNMSIVKSNTESIDSIFEIPLSEEDIEIFEIEPLS
jgi:hypothetical protein